MRSTWQPSVRSAALVYVGATRVGTAFLMAGSEVVAISDDSAAMGRAIGALDGIKVHMMSLSATGINLTVIVDGEQLHPAMERLHHAFFGRA